MTHRSSSWCVRESCFKGLLLESKEKPRSEFWLLYSSKQFFSFPLFWSISISGMFLTCFAPSANVYAWVSIDGSEFWLLCLSGDIFFEREKVLIFFLLFGVSTIRSLTFVKSGSRAENPIIEPGFLAANICSVRIWAQSSSYIFCFSSQSSNH